MSNQNKYNQSKSNNGRTSSSNNDLAERRAHTNSIFDEMLRSSRSVGDNIRDRVAIDAAEQFRARVIADDRQRRLLDARNEARLAPIYDRYQNYDRDHIIERENYRTRARMCAIEREAARAMEEERARMNINWRGPSHSSTSASSNKNSNNSKKNKK